MILTGPEDNPVKLDAFFLVQIYFERKRQRNLSLVWHLDMPKHSVLS